MANKDRNKRSARKARAQERARVAEAQAAASTSASAGKHAVKAQAVPEKRAPKKTEKRADKKPGVFARLMNYLSDVKGELKRVTWPTKEELRSYSVAIIIMLIVFGLVIWLIDSGIVAALVGFTGLRG